VVKTRAGFFFKPLHQDQLAETQPKCFEQENGRACNNREPVADSEPDRAIKNAQQQQAGTFAGLLDCKS
jgi:hypothetical protein